jgi:hypothetical protein
VPRPFGGGLLALVIDAKSESAELRLLVEHAVQLGGSFGQDFGDMIFGSAGGIA